MRTLQKLSLSLILPGAVALAASQSNPILLKSVGESEISVTTAQGTIEKRRVPVEKAAPGAEVIYTTTFLNQGQKAAGNIVVTNPIPANTFLVGGSAFGDNTEITYSINAGKSIASPEKLRIKTAEGRERPAVPAEYTHIHWVYKGELAPHKEGAVGFRVVVK